MIQFLGRRDSFLKLHSETGGTFVNDRIPRSGRFNPKVPLQKRRNLFRPYSCQIGEMLCKSLMFSIRKIFLDHVASRSGKFPFWRTTLQKRETFLNNSRYSTQFLADSSFFLWFDPYLCGNGGIMKG